MRFGTTRALSIYGMATPTVSAGHRRRLGRTSRWGWSPAARSFSGGFLRFDPTTRVAFSVHFVGASCNLYQRDHDRQPTTLSAGLSAVWQLKPTDPRGAPRV